VSYCEEQPKLKSHLPRGRFNMSIEKTIDLPVNEILQSRPISFQHQTDIPMLALGVSVLHSTQTRVEEKEKKNFTSKKHVRITDQ
jgi:hypothetical protein